MKALILIWILVTASASMFSQTTNPTTVKQIEAYVRAIDRINESRKEPDIIVADTADHDSGREKWRIFKSSKDLEKFRENSETYSIANNWLSYGKVVVSVFTLFSPSGDWAKYVTHYYRSDGTVAKIEVDYRTFYGDFIVLKDIWYTSKGKVIKSTTKYLDIATKKPKAPNEMLRENRGLLSGDIFTNTRLLPFSSLIKQTKNR